LIWEKFARLGKLEVHDRTPASQVVERARDAKVVITNKTVLDRDTIARLPRLRHIGIIATGYSTVDVAAARERGIVVCNVPEYATMNVTQAVFALLLELTKSISIHPVRTE
jgi:glycerate dehydrogenase